MLACFKVYSKPCVSENLLHLTVRSNTQALFRPQWTACRTRSQFHLHRDWCTPQFELSTVIFVYFWTVFPRSVASFFLSLSVVLWCCCCPSRLFRGSDWCFSGSCRASVCSVGGGSCCGGWVGHASRRAMLQQLHGVTMYSHDEHHTTTTPYCWTERGKRPLSLTSVRPSNCRLVLWPLPCVVLNTRSVGSSCPGRWGAWVREAVCIIYAPTGKGQRQTAVVSPDQLDTICWLFLEFGGEKSLHPTSAETSFTLQARSAFAVT